LYTLKKEIKENKMAESNELPPIKIAFVLDGEVVDILHTDERLAAIFLSNPISVDITDNMIDNGGTAGIGSLYDPETNTFSIKVSTE
jgi:hypothetical protein